jgi:hypothetical protein
MGHGAPADINLFFAKNGDPVVMVGTLRDPSSDFAK